jgi:heme-degrading monooxygenase HmoA
MVTVIFEVTLNEGMKDAYLKMATNLSDELCKQEGFISLERFTSIETENKMLSLQMWKDEESITKWRENEKHKRTMPVGYDKIFKDYKLKVLTSIRSYGKFDRSEAPIDISKLTNSKNEI